MSDVLFFLVLGVLALLNIAATVVVMRDDYSERKQKVLQTIVVWLVPLLGALVVLAVHRKPEKPSGAYRVDGSGVIDDFAFVRPIAKSIGDVIDGD